MSLDKAYSDFESIEIDYDSDIYWSLEVFPETSDKELVGPDPSLEKDKLEMFLTGRTVFLWIRDMTTALWREQKTSRL